MYLISAKNYFKARKLAIKYRVPKLEWKFIPKISRYKRNKIIEDLKGDIHPDNLIGHFDEDEIKSICGNYLKTKKRKGIKRGLKEGDIVEIVDATDYYIYHSTGHLLPRITYTINYRDKDGNIQGSEESPDIEGKKGIYLGRSKSFRSGSYIIEVGGGEYRTDNRASFKFIMRYEDYKFPNDVPLLNHNQYQRGDILHVISRKEKHKFRTGFDIEVLSYPELGNFVYARDRDAIYGFIHIDDVIKPEGYAYKDIPL